VRYEFDARELVQLAATEAKIEEVSEWLRRDEHGTWKKYADELTQMANEQADARVGEGRPVPSSGQAMREIVAAMVSAATKAIFENAMNRVMR